MTSNKILKRLNDREFKEDIKKYIRTSHEFYGNKLPELKVLAKRLYEEYSLKNFYRVFNKFWISGYPEERTLAIYALELYKDEFDINTWLFIKTKLKDIKSWDKIDSISTNILGEILLREPKVEREIIGLFESKNIWFKKMALMSTIPLIRKGRVKLSVIFCEKEIYNFDENIQKAVGILLKEIGKQKPEISRGFILKNLEMPQKVFNIATEDMKDLRKLRLTRKSDSYLNKLMFWKGLSE